jgi:hypothetical protein
MKQIFVSITRNSDGSVLYALNLLDFLLGVAVSGILGLLL